MSNAIFDSITGYTKYAKALLKDRVRPNLAAPAANRRHLIIIAWLFPPTVNGGVYRPLSFAMEAANQGWEVTVICGPEPEEPDQAGIYLAQKIPATVEVVRIEATHLRPSYRWFPRVDGGFLNALEIANFRLNLKGKPVILASGPPFHSFVAGWFLSRKINAPLVLDYRDEWTLSPFDFITICETDIRWEKRCLIHADSVLVTTKSMGEAIHCAFPDAAENKFTLIPNGYDPTDFELARGNDDSDRHVPAAQKTKLSLAYLGYLSQHANPLAFLDTLAAARRLSQDSNIEVELRFIGKRDPLIVKAIETSAASELVTFHDQVTKAEAARIMTDADALLLLNPKDFSKYLPGKLFDYIASGARILVYGSGGEVERAVAKSGSGLIVPDGDAQTLAKTLRTLCLPAPAEENTARAEWLKKHQRSYVAQKLLDHLEQVLSKSQAAEPINQ